MRPRLVFQPGTNTGMQQGINVIADAVRPTLGPLPRFVSIDPVSRGNRQPELLDDGGLIARRIVALPDRNADMGAMFLRQVLWKQHEEAGDGTATTAVLFQSVYNQGVKYIAAGGNPMRLRHSLEHGLKRIVEALERMTIPLDGEEAIAHLARSICQDEPLAEALGAVFDVIGEQGLLEIRSGHSRALEHEFIDGTYFKGGLHPKAAAALDQRSLEVVDAITFVGDLDLDDPQDLVRLIALTAAAQKQALVIVARTVSEQVGTVLASVNRDPTRFQIVVAKLPDDLQIQPAMLDDLAVLLGGRAFLRAVGDTIDSAKLDDLGRVRRAWADREYLGIVGGKGSPLGLRSHVAALRRAIDQTDDLASRKHLRERIGRLLGGAALLRCGGSTDLEINLRKASAERTAEALRGALAHGILPGGGAALLACRRLFSDAAACADSLDERVAYDILSRALEAPTRAIVENAGYDAEPIIAQIDQPGAGFDARSGQIADMGCAGIVDSAGVIISAVHQAIASAALALTVDVLVHHRSPTTAIDP